MSSWTRIFNGPDLFFAADLMADATPSRASALSFQTWNNFTLSKVLAFVIFLLCEFLDFEPRCAFSRTLFLLSLFSLNP
jgi:hypothetical protein